MKRLKEESIKQNTFKTIVSENPPNIKNFDMKAWDELTGTVKNIEDQNNRIILYIDNYRIVLKKSSIKNRCFQILNKQLLSKRIGLIKTDDHLKPFAIRILNQQITNHLKN
jgi:hypothetical protein